MANRKRFGKAFKRQVIDKYLASSVSRSPKRFVFPAEALYSFEEKLSRLKRAVHSLE